MQRLVSPDAECQRARPPQRPTPAPSSDPAEPTPAAASSVARTLTVHQYLEELWAVEGRPAQLVRPDEECDESARLTPEEDDEPDAATAASVTAASGPGSLASMLHSLYQVPPAVPAGTGDKRHVHLLPRHPNLLPIEEWVQPAGAAAAVTAAGASAASPARPIATAATGAHQLHFASVPLSLQTLFRFYQRPGLLSSMSCSPSSLSASAVLSPSQTRFMVYQLLHCLTWLHEERGVSHGALTPSNLRLTISNGKVWIYLAGMRFEMPEPEACGEISPAQQLQRRPRRSSAAARPRVERLLSPLLAPADSLCFRWWSGALSNLQYILALNTLAGRTPFGAGSDVSFAVGGGSDAVGYFSANGESAATAAGSGPFPGDVAFHPIVPWVVDFTATDAAVAAAKSAASAAGSPFSLAAALPSLIVYRDLRKSKYRLKKGDEQLDFQFTNSTPHKPYHITECLSDITFSVYRARITPLSILRRTVRQNFVPEEYPNTISKMERWTPDEAIPELFGVCFESDVPSPSAVPSTAIEPHGCFHPRACSRDFMKALPGHREKGMYDLAVPAWIVEIEEEKRRRSEGGGARSVAAVASDLDPHALFVSWHASQLESDHVSAHLHHWIDLNFGYKLSGAAAVAAKNVPLIYEQHQQETAAAGGRAAATTASGNGGASNAAPSVAPLCVFDLPRRPSFVQLFDRPHPPRRATSTRKVAPAASSSSSAAHAGSATAAVDLALVDAAPRSLAVAPPSEPSTAAGLAAIPLSLSALHSFEYFHSFNSTLFEAAVEGGCYRTPPRGIMQWRRARAKEEERKRRRRRSNREASSDSSSDDDDEDDADSSTSPSSASSTHWSDTDSEVASLPERAADDMFRFGLVLFELYAARPLFTEKSFHAYCACENEARAIAVLLAPLPTEIAAVASRCLALDWRARVTAGELLRAPIHGGLGLFRVLEPHAPHALTLSPVTNLMLNPYAELWRFLRQWRCMMRRYAGGMEGLLGSHATCASGGASIVAANGDVTPATSTVSADTSASAMLLTPFSVPSQRPPSVHASSSSRPATPSAPLQQQRSVLDAQQQTVHSTFSFSVSHASNQSSLSETTNAAASPSSAAQMFDSSHCFWACADHGIAQAVPPPSTDDDPTDVASMLRWSLGALHALHVRLWAAAPSVFLLSLPHVLDLCLTPSFLHDPGQHDLLRLVVDTLARLVGPAHAAVHVAPFLAQLLFHSSALSFQLSFVWQMETLRLVRDRFAYRDMQQPYMRALRNALLSSVPALAERAHDLLLQCVRYEMDLGSSIAAAVPRSAAISVVPASPSPTDEELLVFELLRPMFQRLSASPASTHANAGPVPGSAPSSGLVSPPPSASSVDKILGFLFALLPELPTNLQANFVLPNVMQLVSANGVHVLPPAGQIGVVGAGARASALSASNADLDGKLANALDLLFALLPDLSLDTLHALWAEESLLRALFLSVSPAPPLVGGIAPRSISAHAMRKVIQIMVYACCELAGDRIEPTQTAGASRTAQQMQQQQSRFSFFLPCVSDFLRGVLMRLDASSSLDPTLSTHYSASELQGFLHSVYVSLSSILGRPAMQQAIAQADKVESMVQEHAKQQYEEAQARTAAAAAGGAVEHPTAAAASALQSASSSSGMNELLRARQHALQGKNSRLTWLRAQQSRALALQHSREPLQHERAELAFQAGISIAGDSQLPRRPRPDAGQRGSFIDASSSAPATAAAAADGVSVVVDQDGEGGEGDLSGDEADEPSPALSTATPHSQSTPSHQQSLKSPAAALPQSQQPDSKGVKKNKLTGFFSTGIFAPRGSPSNATAAGGAGSQQVALGTSDGAAQSPLNALPPPNLSSAPSASVAASNGSSGAPTSAISPPSHHLPLSSARVPLDLGDMILPPALAAAAFGSTVGAPVINARFEPSLRCTFRAHVGGLSSLDCHPASGLFISSSRTADAHSTVKLWSVSVSDSSIRPLFDYNKKHHASSSASALASPPRFPKTPVSHVQLLVNPYEVLNAAYAYCDGAQLHVCDIETHKPIVFRHNSGVISSGSGSNQPPQLVAAKGQPPARHLSGNNGDPLLAAPSPASLVSAPSSASSSSFVSGAPHHFKSDGSALIGGISCFDYSPALHSLVLGTGSGGLRWLDLRSGGGFVSSAWHLNNSGPVAPALRCVLASESGGGGGGVGAGSCAASSSLVYAGLSTGDVVVFDSRTGCVLLQWRAHDGPILSLSCFCNPEGMPVVVVSGGDHALSVWMISGGACPVLLQRFLNLEENARGVTILRGAAAGAVQLSCTVGSRMALVAIQTSELTPGSKRPSTVLPLAPVSGYKGKSAFSCQTHLPLYGLSLLGTDDGRIIGAK